MPAETDGKFIKAPLAPGEAGAEAPQSITASATDFIENDAFPMLAVAIVTVFLIFQFGRWALSFRRQHVDDVDNLDDFDDLDEAPPPPKPVNIDRTPWRAQQADRQSPA